MSDIAPPITRTNVFDPAYNSVVPGSDQQPPAATQRDFGVRPEAPQEGQQQTTVSPDHVFDDAYNLVPPKTGDRQEAPFDSRFNEVLKPTDFPAFKGRVQPFNQNGEIGKMYVDENSGLVVGMEFNEGSKKGQKLVFDRDAEGNITKMHVLMPGQENAQSQYLKFEKTDKGWVSQPAGQSVPGFKHLESQNGAIVGNFKVNAKGDFEYESPDKLTKNVLRLNGDKDYFNMRDYARERESLNGQKATTYWSGYEWLPGEKQQVASGVVKVTFQPQPGKPAYMVRDANTNGFQVEFTAEKLNYKVDNWHEGRMTRVTNGATDTIYSTGAQNAEGKLQWRKGQERVENGQRIVQFNDQQDAEKVSSGELPMGSMIDTTTGDVTSVFANGTQVRADKYGRQQRITYKNQQYIDVLRDANSDFRGYRRSDNTVILKGGDVAVEGAQPGSAWIVQRPGQQPVRFNGTLKPGNAGAFNIVDQNNDGLTVSADGVLSTKLQGQVVTDQPTQTTPPEPRPEEPTKDAAAAKFVPSETEPRPSDKPPNKAPLTDEQLRALSQKHRVAPKLLAQARAKAEAQGLHETFTEENLDKFFTMAAKHELLRDFTDKTYLGPQAKPGAHLSKVIPELLADPATAMGALNAQMKADMQKALDRGGANAGMVNSIMASVERRFQTIKTGTEPFVTELATVLGPRQTTPPPERK